jgi:hypothetical protein
MHYDTYAQAISGSLVLRVVVMAVVVAVLAVWLHLWWLAVLYVVFWAAMLPLGRRRARG